MLRSELIIDQSHLVGRLLDGWLVGCLIVGEHGGANSQEHDDGVRFRILSLISVGRRVDEKQEEFYDFTKSSRLQTRPMDCATTSFSGHTR